MNPDALADDWPYFVEVAVRAETDRNWDRTKDSNTYDANRLAVYTGPFKMTYYFDQYTLYETGQDLLVARRVKQENEAVMADYLQGLIDSFQEVELDLSKGEVSDEDLRILRDEEGIERRADGSWRRLTDWTASPEDQLDIFRRHAGDDLLVELLRYYQKGKRYRAERK